MAEEAKAPELYKGPKIEAFMKARQEFPDLPVEGQTEEEAAQLDSIKEGVLKGLELEAPPSDYRHFFFTKGMLTLWLREAEGDKEKAIANAVEAIKWYEEKHYFDGWLGFIENPAQDEAREVMKKYLAEGTYGLDKRGVPVFYSRVALYDTVGMKRECTGKAYVCYCTWVFEELVQRQMEISKEKGVFLLGQLTVMDLNGMSWSQGQNNVPTIMWIVNTVLKGHFPGFAKNCFLVNTPWYFKAGYTLVSPFIPAENAKTMQIFAGDCLEALQEHVDISQIPTWLGGENEEPWQHSTGGTVPVSDPSCSVLDAPWVLELARGEVGQIPIEVPPYVTCSYEFSVEEGSLEWSIEEGEKVMQESKTLDAADGVQQGELVADAAARRLAVKLDNSGAWWNAKKVLYKVKFSEPSKAE